MIKVEKLYKSFGTHAVTKGLDLQVEDGEFLALVGGSGEGKSVLLKQLIGLLRPDSGRIIINDLEINSLPDHELDKVFSQCGYVFQFAALLDSLNVLENVGIILFEQGMAKSEIEKIVIQKLQDVGLDASILEKYPSELSGGMKKRVGLARTLIREPKVLIYDEPTTGLDLITVTMIHKLMREVHDRTKAITIAISHDIGIFDFADQIAMLYQGKIIYKGPAKTIWECDNPFVHQFIRGQIDGPIKH